MFIMQSWRERQGHGTQLNREAGSSYADKQGGGVYGIQLDLGDGSATSVAAVSIGEQSSGLGHGGRAMVDIFYKHCQHLYSVP